MDECKESLKKKLESLCCLCGEIMIDTQQIGQHCTNKKCDNLDGPSVWDAIQRTNYFMNVESMKTFETWKKVTK